LNQQPGHWIDPQPVDVPQAIRDQIGEPQFLAEALVRRGFTESQRLREFLDPFYYHPARPDSLPDLQKAADRIESAVQSGETIGVWGDFDVDGQTATSLLVQTLQILGARVQYFIPIRERDSHGVSLPALQTFLGTGVDLVLTCDTGISAHESVIYARERGIDFIITDHHTLPESLPPAVAVVNSQRLPPGEALSLLCGVGCAFKLAEELLVRANLAEQLESLLDLVALGTIADLALLTGDNRYLVQRGLERLRTSPRPAVEAILELSEDTPAQITEELISFIIAPRLNALGRLDDANPAVPFFLAKTLAEAQPMAARLEGLNARRKLLCDQVFQAAQAQLERDRSLLEHPVILLGHPAWPGGVLGIVASRLTEIYLKPTILLTMPPGEPARGSARSVEGVNITQAIASAHHLLNNFGGHPMAAGLSLDATNISEVHQLIDEDASQQQSQAQLPALSLVIDAFVPLDRLNLDLVKSLDRLAPFGPGNRALTLVSRNLVMQSQVQFGKNNEHLQLLVEDTQGNTQKVVWWQGRCLKAGLTWPIRYTLPITTGSQRSRWNGKVSDPFRKAFHCTSSAQSSKL
jgi:single-stranded-DNA-specific exonuclease